MRLTLTVLLLATAQFPPANAFQPSTISKSRGGREKQRKDSFIVSYPSSTTVISVLGDNYLDGLSHEADEAAKESAEAARAAARAAAAAEEAALSLAIEEQHAEKAAAEAAAAEKAAAEAAAAAETAALEAANEKAAADAAANAVKEKGNAIEGLAAGISSMMDSYGHSPPSQKWSPKDNIEDEVDEKLQKISSLLDKQTRADDKIRQLREVELEEQERMVEELLKQEQELNERTEVLQRQLEDLQEDETMWKDGDEQTSDPMFSFPAAEVEGSTISDTKTNKIRKKGGPLLKLNEATIEFTAGVLGGVVGFAMGGPAGAAVGAAAANYVVKTDSDAGDAVYNLSRSSIETFNYMVKFEDKYEVLAGAKRKIESVLKKNLRSNKKIDPETLKKLESALENTEKRLKELDDRYDLVDGAGVALSTIGDLVERGVNTAVKINEDYRLTEKVGDTIKEAVKKPLKSDSSFPPYKE